MKMKMKMKEDLNGTISFSQLLSSRNSDGCFSPNARLVVAQSRKWIGRYLSLVNPVDNFLLSSNGVGNICVIPPAHKYQLYQTVLRSRLLLLLLLQPV